ncbi:hypothetical protein CR67_07035, partial [Campylobacter hyointestinalis subsp. hyointestinalis]
MKNISDSNLMNQISRDGKTSIEALNAMLKSSDNINGVTLNDFLGSLGAKDRAVAEANIIKNLMDKNSVNGVVDFRALNKSLNSLDFGSEFAKELKSQILSKQSILNNTSDILNSLGDRVIKPKTMSQGVTNDPLKRADTMRANFIVEKMKPLIPYLGNNEALKLHLNRAILNANGDFKLAIKNIDNIPSGNLPTPTRNLLNEFKNAMKEIEQAVKNEAKTQAKTEAKKEIRGIHNVTYNDKKATYIKTDLENVDSAIRYANTNRDKGAKHIKIRHLMDETKPGYITNQELLNLGNSLREYIKTYKEPFIDKNGARIYEWENKEGVKFRVVVDSSRRDATTAELPQPTATDDIITFYSDRNIKDKMIFRNPKLNQTIKEAENQANLVNQSIKGDGFVTYPNSARQETAINQNFDIQEWVKNMSGVLSDEWRANLSKLADKHPEMFRSEADVFRVIKEIKDNPTHFFKNYNDKVALIGKQINNDKFANIGIVKNDGEIIHANKNKIKDLERLQRRNKEMLTGTPLPATTQANSSMGGDLLQHSNTQTIPNQTIKEAENLAKTQATPTAKEPTKQSIKEQELTAQATKEVEINNTEKPRPNTNSRYENIKKFVEGKTNKALDNEINAYNQLYRYVLDDFAKAHPSELNLPQYASEMANYITKEFLIKHDKEIKEIINQKASGENRQIALEAFENLKQNFDELRIVGIGDLIKPTAKGIKDKIAQVQIKSMSDKELVTQFQKLSNSKARVNENVFSYLQNEIKQREKKLYPFINSDKKDYSYDLEKQLKNRGLMGLKDSDLENIAKERNSILYLPSYVRGNIEKELNITPIKEFGTNYAEFYHDGANAIKKLLAEKQGQVAGAFERKELGDIDLVWGEVADKVKHTGYGVSHILDKRIAEFMEQGFSKEEAQNKAIDFVKNIDKIIKNGNVVRDDKGRIRIENDNFIIGIKDNYYGTKTNNWIVTGYIKKENAESLYASSAITKGETLPLN